MADIDEVAPLAREGEHVPPTFRSEAFHCPHCGVLAEQQWMPLIISMRTMVAGSANSGVFQARCRNCNNRTLWLEEGQRMIEPRSSSAPRPHVDMPQDVKGDYEEARAIVMDSPRGACALLRLATQKLADDLVEGSASLDQKIATLVSEGVASQVAQALDALRVVGNNAVHPLEMNLDDDVGTASALFECLNVIVEDRVARPRRIGRVFEKLPEGARAAITRRDGH